MAFTIESTTEALYNLLEVAVLDGDEPNLRFAVGAIEREGGTNRDRLRERCERGAERISRHAVDRYRERVDEAASRGTARLAIEQILRAGRRRPTPRRWMRRVRKTPGLRFVYWHERPDVCLLILGAAVVTVMTRARSRECLRDGTRVAEVIALPVRPATVPAAVPPLDAAA